MLKTGLVIRGKQELAWYGYEITHIRMNELLGQYADVSDIQLLDPYDDYFEGILVRDPGDVSRDIEMLYYLPEEESPESLSSQRSVDLTQSVIITRRPARKKSETGYVYLCGGEIGGPSLEIKHFDTGFMPPFKPGDLTLFLDDLTDHGFKGFILSHVRYCGKDEVYSENSVLPGRSLESAILED